jgi:hypothetical protein
MSPALLAQAGPLWQVLLGQTQRSPHPFPVGADAAPRTRFDCAEEREQQERQEQRWSHRSGERMTARARAWIGGKGAPTEGSIMLLCSRRKRNAVPPRAHDSAVREITPAPAIQSRDSGRSSPPRSALLEPPLAPVHRQLMLEQGDSCFERLATNRHVDASLGAHSCSVGAAGCLQDNPAGVVWQVS